MHARNGHLSTSGLKSDVTIVFFHPTNSFLLLGVFTSVSILVIKKCDRESAHRRTDAQTQTQTGFIICPMLGEIINTEADCKVN